jgi:hypothetical protein
VVSSARSLDGGISVDVLAGGVALLGSYGVTHVVAEERSAPGGVDQLHTAASM